MCFGAKGNDYGQFKAAKGGKLRKIKLVHLKGYVACTGPAPVYWSHWGFGLYGNGGSTNRPFPSSKNSHFQSEAKCEAIDMKMIFNYDANKTHFHNKDFALSLVLKVKFFGTRKWPISLFSP